MQIVLSVLLGIAMLGTLGVMFAGMLGLTKGDGNPARSNTLMRWRVMLQGLSLALFVALMLVMGR